MQWLKCNFAKKWNKVHNITGHVWGERFFSRIIKNTKEFINVITYIDENPVDAGLVQNAVNWAFGGLSHWLNGIQGVVDDWLKSEFMFTVSPPFIPV
jgi:putative transposase